MTAPKQEKWAANNLSDINVKHICCIGAVFDFYAGTVKSAPELVIAIGMEWFFRLIEEPRRMWRRYILGNLEFIWLIIKEKYFNASEIPCKRKVLCGPIFSIKIPTGFRITIQVKP